MASVAQRNNCGEALVNQDWRLMPVTSYDPLHFLNP